MRAFVRVARADINDDGADELFYYFDDGSGHCGSAGCWSLIFERRGAEWKLICGTGLSKGVTITDWISEGGYRELEDRYVSYKGLDGNKNTNNSGAAYGDAWASGDVISVALNMDSGKIWCGKNGTWQASGDPAAGTNEMFASITGTIYAGYAANSASWTATANFGASAFAHTVPTGFNAGFGA